MKKILLILFLFFFSFSVKAQFFTPSQLTSIHAAKSASEGDMYLDTVNKNYFIGLTTGELSRIGFIDSISFVKDSFSLYQGDSIFTVRIKAGGIDSMKYENDTLRLYTTDSLFEVKIVPDFLINGLDNSTVYYITDSSQVGGGSSTLLLGNKVSRLKESSSKFGHYGNVFLMTDNSIKTCGYAGNRGFGSPDGQHAYTPVNVPIETAYPPRGKFISVHADNRGIMALTDSGEVYSRGYNGYGQLGHGNTTQIGILKKIQFFETNNIHISQLYFCGVSSSTVSSAFAVSDVGEVYSWGYNGYGQLGHGNTTQLTAPQKITAFTGITITKLFIGDGRYMTISAIDNANNLYTWGRGTYGSLGQGSTANINTPTLVSGIKATEVAMAGGNSVHYTLVITKDSNIMGAGYNAYGQLGDGSTTQRTSFVNTSPVFDSVAEIDVTNQYGISLFVTYGRELYITGYNGFGQHGNGTTTNSNTFNKVTAPFQGMVKKARIGGWTTGSYVVVLDTLGRLWGAGYNAVGQLGRGDFTTGVTTRTFEQYNGLPIGAKIVDFCFFGLSTSGGVTVLLEDGRAFSTGWNVSYGASGNGMINNAVRNNSIFYEVKF